MWWNGTEWVVALLMKTMMKTTMRAATATAKDNNNDSKHPCRSMAGM
jgi:hypothetical protein